MEDGGSIATGGEAQFSVSSFRNFKHLYLPISRNKICVKIELGRMYKQQAPAHTVRGLVV